MRPITGDCACGGFFLHPRKGAFRVYCDECRKQRDCMRSARWTADNPTRDKKNRTDWYVRNRKNNPQWRALNKERAKLWRAANREHIRAYREARP